MKIAHWVRYVGEVETVLRLRPSHRAYMAEILAQGRLFAAGPFEDGTGALFIYEVDDLAAAEAIVAADPYSTGGAVKDHELKPWRVVSVAVALARPSP